MLYTVLLPYVAKLARQNNRQGRQKMAVHVYPYPMVRGAQYSEMVISEDSSPTREEATHLLEGFRVDRFGSANELFWINQKTRLALISISEGDDLSWRTQVVIDHVHELMRYHRMEIDDLVAWSLATSGFYSALDVFDRFMVIEYAQYHNFFTPKAPVNV